MSALQWELLTSMILDTLESVPNHVDGLVMTCPTHPGTPEPVSRNRLLGAAPPMPGNKPYCGGFAKLKVSRAAITGRFVVRTMMLVSCILEWD